MRWRGGYDLLWKAIIKSKKKKWRITLFPYVHILWPGQVSKESPCIIRFTTEASRHHEWNTGSLVSVSLTGGSWRGSGGIVVGIRDRGKYTWSSEVFRFFFMFLCPYEFPHLGRSEPTIRQIGENPHRQPVQTTRRQLRETSVATFPSFGSAMIIII
jgi:hypothetical protein